MYNYKGEHTFVCSPLCYPESTNPSWLFLKKVDRLKCPLPIRLM